jgi:2-oxoisovalerate dehydrogenase E2 component (dihydrolipoyl transacylase)
MPAFIASGGLPPAAGPQPDETVEEIKVIGLRRKIAERMEIANRIPHITIVEEIDATAVEDLRARMATGGKLTLLPFLARAIVKAVRAQPALNAQYDAEAGLLRRFGAVHLGIAAQTPAGLMVPVVRHAEALDLRGLAAEIARLGAAAKDGQARRDELSGSTITITSLGPLGAIATTPILNVPEVAIVGVNRLAVRPFWNGTAFEPRKMMNLSCSFDHRVIDGWDAAVFVARLKELLETPALIFVEG